MNNGMIGLGGGGAPSAWGVAGGTANALTLVTVTDPGLFDGTIIGVRAAAANTSVTPTLSLNNGPHLAIVKNGGLAVSVGDIPGQYAESLFRFNAANTRWELLNPAKGVISVLAKSGAAANVPADTTEDTLATIAVPANAMGANGVIRFFINTVQTNNANAKTLRIRFSGAAGTIVLQRDVNSTAYWQFRGEMMNASATNSQRLNATEINSTGGVASTSATSAIDTTAATTLVITGQKASAGDTFTLTNYGFELISDGA